VLSKFESLAKVFGELEMEQIKASTITAWQTSMKVQGYSPKTIQNFRSVLSLILHYANGDGLITQNPLSFVKLPKKTRKEVFAFRVEEIKQILASASGQFKNILQLAFFSGMRPSEIIALKWSKVDFNHDTIRVNLCRVDGVEDLPKGHKERIIDILPQVKEALQRQRFLTASKGDDVFLNQYGRIYQSSKVLDTSFKKLLESIGLPVVRFYTTKKSFITLMKSMRMNESWIIQQVGHEDKLVSREHYTAKLDQNFDCIRDIAV
jgi:integrase